MYVLNKRLWKPVTCCAFLQFLLKLGTFFWDPKRWTSTQPTASTAWPRVNLQPPATGLLVYRTERSSWAEAAGLQRGDQLVKVSGVDAKLLRPWRHPKKNAWETKARGFYRFLLVIVYKIHLKEWYIRVILAGDHVWIDRSRGKYDY